MDSAKSYCWALTTGARKQLALWPFKTVTSATELGAVLSFTKRHCTGQQLKKFMALKTRWKALQQSWAPIHHKLATLPLTFWASALHGVFVACFGEIHLDKLRSCAISALRLKRLEQTLCCAWVYQARLRQTRALARLANFSSSQAHGPKRTQVTD